MMQEITVLKKRKNTVRGWGFFFPEGQVWNFVVRGDKILAQIIMFDRHKLVCNPKNDSRLGATMLMRRSILPHKYGNVETKHMRTPNLRRHGFRE